MASLHPQHGARVVLERERFEGASATYAVTVYEPDGVEQATRAHFTSDGVAVDPWARALDGWLDGFVDRLVKSFAKTHAGGPWPRKITRWRAER